jgi:hypothetical protein
MTTCTLLRDTLGVESTNWSHPNVSWSNTSVVFLAFPKKHIKAQKLFLDLSLKKSKTNYILSSTKGKDTLQVYLLKKGKKKKKRTLQVFKQELRPQT